MRIRNGFDSLFWSGLKTGAENYIFCSEIRSGFGELGGTPPGRIPGSTPPPPTGIHSQLYLSRYLPKMDT